MPYRGHDGSAARFDRCLFWAPCITASFHYVLILWARPTFWQSEAQITIWRERKARYWLVKVGSWWRGERRGQGSPILENVTSLTDLFLLADFTVGRLRMVKFISIRIQVFFLVCVKYRVHGGQQKVPTPSHINPLSTLPSMSTSPYSSTRTLEILPAVI